VEIVQEASLPAPVISDQDDSAQASLPDDVADSDPDDPDSASRHDVVADISAHDDVAPTPTQVIFLKL
jgi:hypothetical protein